MELRSSLYDCTIMHHRVRPRRHAFAYRLFMFALDLDEIERIIGSSRLIGRRWNLFAWSADDHIRYPGLGTRESVIEFLRREGCRDPVDRILLVTHLRMFGYVFNPVSFFFCLGPGGAPVCAVAEVHNTFGERKLYLIPPDGGEGPEFRLRRPKHFYVSPFVRLDAEFDFRLRLPDDDLKLFVTDYAGGERLIVTSLVGRAAPLSDARLALYALRYPFITLRIVALIHWHAFRLWLKRIPFIRKAADPHLQREVIHGNS